MIRLFLLFFVVVGTVSFWAYRAKHPGHIVVNFETYQNGTQPSGWDIKNGLWSVVQPAGSSKEYRKISGPTDSAALYGSTAWGDYSVQCDVNPESNANDTGISLLGRVRDFTHYYQLELKHGTMWTLYKNDGGKWTEIGQGDFKYKAGAYYLLRLDMNGSTITGSISTDRGASFVTLARGTDHGWPSGKIGLRCWSMTGRFDNIEVTGH